MMLFIGGTRDGQKIRVPWNRGNPVFKIDVEQEPIKYSGIKDIMLSVKKYVETEIYIKKEIWEKEQCIFCVMVKDGSLDLLDAFLDEYNK